MLHHSLPKSLEGYHQETGRAGRDGLAAYAYLFYSYQDAIKARHMLRQSAEESGTPREVLQSNMESLNAMVRGSDLGVVVRWCVGLSLVWVGAFNGTCVFL